MQQSKIKWRFAIGTTSLVPSTNPRRHYLIADIDTKKTDAVDYTIAYLRLIVGCPRISCHETEHGWHIYTQTQLPWSLLIDTLKNVPNVDRNWLRIGKRRGYLFLADKDYFYPNWPVVRMLIRHGEN
jgi:hypothetical protein